MTRPPLFPALLLGLALPALLAGADSRDEGFTPMFNGKDLTGWVNVNCHPGTFFVKDNEIITTGKPTGFLRTERQYENFIAEFDWMHIPPKPGAVGNSGFFVWADPLPAVGTGYTRGIEVQVLVNLTYRNKKGDITATSQGDLFSIWGATCTPDRPHPDGWARCLPSEDHCKGEREWNHYRVEANNGVLKLAVNGHVVSGLSQCRPRKGYLALESEGSECHFRNLKIKELPSTNPKPEETAKTAEGFTNLYFGDLTGWKAGEGQQTHWLPKDWVLRGDGMGGSLWSAKEYGDFELIVDCRLPDKKASCTLAVRGEKGGAVTVGPDTKLTVSSASERVGTEPTGKPAGQWNRLRIRVAGDRLGGDIEGETGPWRAWTRMAGAPATGPIALRAEGGPVEFGNIFIRELKK